MSPARARPQHGPPVIRGTDAASARKVSGSVASAAISHARTRGRRARLNGHARFAGRTRSDTHKPPARAAATTRPAADCPPRSVHSTDPSAPIANEHGSCRACARRASVRTPAQATAAARPATRPAIADTTRYIATAEPATRPASNNVRHSDLRTSTTSRADVRIR